MKRKNIWLKKALAVSICAAMAIQPAVTFAEDFSEESVQEATGEVDEETEIGDAAVKEPEVTEEPSEEMPEEPAEDTEIPDVVEELPENEDSQVEDLEPDAAAEGDMDDEDDHEDECINCSQDIDWKFIANVRKNIEDNIDNPALTVDVLCNLMGMSRTSFYNKLRALTDQAPGDYIRLIRLKRSVKLLKEGTHSITEIAEMTGFSDAKYFREVFKKHFNVSPSQYGKEGKPHKEGKAGKENKSDKEGGEKEE